MNFNETVNHITFFFSHLWLFCVAVVEAKYSYDKTGIIFNLAYDNITSRLKTVVLSYKYTNEPEEEKKRMITRTHAVKYDLTSFKMEFIICIGIYEEKKEEEK